MAMANLGSFKGNATNGVNLIDTFKADVKRKYPNRTFSCVKKIAIETTPGIEITVNDAVIEVPESGVIEFGYNMIDVTELIFSETTIVNIVYMY